MLSGIKFVSKDEVERQKTARRKKDEEEIAAEKRQEAKEEKRKARGEVKHSLFVD